ncbi:MAG: hypothetical protein ACO2ZM_07610 [Francisellaceae bacterium]
MTFSQSETNSFGEQLIDLQGQAVTNKTIVFDQLPTYNANPTLLPGSWLDSGLCTNQAISPPLKYQFPIMRSVSAICYAKDTQQPLSVGLPITADTCDGKRLNVTYNNGNPRLICE